MGHYYPAIYIKEMLNMHEETWRLYIAQIFFVILRSSCGVNKCCKFDVFSTVHHRIELFHQPTLMHNFLCSLTICLLHYYPQHVSSINMPIFSIHTNVCPVHNQCTGQTFIESEDNRCCVNTIFPPEDWYVNARNMSRIIV